MTIVILDILKNLYGKNWEAHEQNPCSDQYFLKLSELLHVPICSVWKYRSSNLLQYIHKSEL